MLLMMQRIGLKAHDELAKPGLGFKVKHIVHVKADHGQVLNYWLKNDSAWRRFNQAVPKHTMMEFFVSLKSFDEPPEGLKLWRWYEEV